MCDEKCSLESVHNFLEPLLKEISCTNIIIDYLGNYKNVINHILLNNKINKYIFHYNNIYGSKIIVEHSIDLLIQKINSISEIYFLYQIDKYLERENSRSKFINNIQNIKNQNCILFAKLDIGNYILIGLQYSKIYIYVYQNLNNDFISICNLQYQSDLLFKCIKSNKIKTYIM